MPIPAADNFGSRLAGILGPQAVVDSACLPDYAIGAFIPMAAVRPENADEVAAVLQWAHRNNVAVYPTGGRTLTHLGNTPTRPRHCAGHDRAQPDA